MYYVIIALVCLVIGYGLGVFSAKKIKQEIYEALEVLNGKIDNIQKKIK